MTQKSRFLSSLGNHKFSQIHLELSGSRPSWGLCTLQFFVTVSVAAFSAVVPFKHVLHSPQSAIYFTLLPTQSPHACLCVYMHSCTHVHVDMHIHKHFQSKISCKQCLLLLSSVHAGIISSILLYPILLFHIFQMLESTL